ncbi:uncharacterized protein LOC101854871 [Aplysia californica]|uniref:Uncharacterized protein LOC101854871 n=1 Tax=Aplysia californica TaxID=6500 RepID=A0ABM0JS39_APLCA|nr:uncharacterized protein LOC101854871 [Aplysia californica]
MNRVLFGALLIWIACGLSCGTPSFCYDKSILINKFRVCIEDAGMLQYYDFSSGQPMVKDNDYRQFCNNTEGFVTATDCSLQIMKQCLPPTATNLLPGKAFQTRMISSICNDSTLKQDCFAVAQTKQTDITYCVKRAMNPNSDDLACDAMKASQTCTFQEMRPCDEHTAQFYSSMLQPEVDRVCNGAARILTDTGLLPFLLSILAVWLKSGVN